MKKIASFCVNHDLLTPGIYLSRIDGDVVTYDIRMVKPNCPPYLPNGALHTLEHLFATYARNSEYAEHVIYFLTSGMTHEQVIELIRACFRWMASYEGEIPGAATSAECGNYLEHDLPEARRWAASFLPVIADWGEENLSYQA